jgi:KTSC domain
MPADFAPEGRWVSLSSSVLSAALWEGTSETLLLRFNSGRTYPYHDVPYEVWDGLYNASSHGKYYNRFIKGQYV